MIEQSDFLTPEHCAEIVESINKNRELLIPRRNGLFYTFGPASYLDATLLDKERYIKLAQEYKSVFQSFDFLWLYNILNAKLSSLIGPTFLSRDYAWPGFHIFLNSKAAQSTKASVHRDLQWQALFPNHYKAKIKKYSEEEIIPPETFTFTIPVYLPERGSGLNIFRENEASIYFPYELGKLYYFFGDDMTHQISGFNTTNENERRITMQGHGILKKDGMWEVYW